MYQRNLSPDNNVCVSMVNGFLLLILSRLKSLTSWMEELMHATKNTWVVDLGICANNFREWHWFDKRLKRASTNGIHTFDAIAVIILNIARLTRARICTTILTNTFFFTINVDNLSCRKQTKCFQHLSQCGFTW